MPRTKAPASLPDAPPNLSLGTPNPPTPPSGLLPADRFLDYISGDGYFWLKGYVQALPRYIDDATADLGDDLYERMAHDGIISGNLSALKASILDDSVQLSSAVPDVNTDGHALAATILDFCQGVMDDLQPAVDETLWDMLDALHLGNRLAELVYRTIPYQGSPRLALKSAKVKPRIAYAYAEDAYKNLVGILGLIPGVSFPVTAGQLLVNPQKTVNLIAPEKFALLAFRPKEGGYQGTSILRPAYTAWWQKMQLWPEYLKYLTQFASPLIAAIRGPTANPTATAIDPTTGKAIDSVLAALQQLRNGAAIVLPNGTILDIKQSQGDGAPFLKAFEYLDSQITVTMLSQTLATGAHHANTRAAAQVHHDVLTTLVSQMKMSVIRMIRRHMLGRMVAYNWGDEAARLLTPKVNLGQTEKPDQAGLLASMASIPGFKVYPSQLPGIYELLDLPAADPEEIAQDDAAQQALQRTTEATGTPATGQSGTSGQPASTGQSGITKPAAPVPKALIRVPPRPLSATGSSPPMEGS